MSEIQNSADQPVAETRSRHVGARAAEKRLRPNARTPRTPSKKSGRKVGRPSTEKPATTMTATDASSPKRSRKTARPANGNAKPCEPPPAEIRDSHLGSEIHSFAAVAGDDHGGRETQATPVIATIQELWRRRQAWHRAEKSLTLQAKAICRRYVGGDKDEADKLFATVTGQHLEAPANGASHVTVAILPLTMARDTIEKQRKACEKELARLAASLPIAAWAGPIRGFGFLSLAALVGECGNIGSYKSASAVWKRMGLAVIGGTRQRRLTGPDALAHGYSPQRRSVAWNIGVSLMRAQKSGDTYRDFYDADKTKQLAKEIDGKPLTAGHAHNRACRHMTKRFLADLYGAWRTA